MQRDSRVEYIKRLLDNYASFAAEWRRQAKEDEEFADGAQWTPKEIKSLEAKRMSPIMVNMITPTIDQAVSMLTTNKPKFSATARGDGDNEVAKLFSDILSYIWDANGGQGETELKIAITDYYKKGIGYLYPYYDPNGDFGQGDIKIKSIDPFNVFIDPSSKDRHFQDASNIIISTLLPKDRILFLYPQYTEQLKDAIPSTETRTPVGSNYGTEGQTTYTNGKINPNEEYYEVIEHFTKVKVPYFRVNIKNLSYVKVFDEQEFEEYKQIKTFAVRTNQGLEYALTEQDINYWAGMYEKYGPVFHYIQAPDGQPTPVEGAEEEGPNAIPGSTITLQPLTFGDLIEQGIILVDQYYQERVKRSFIIGDVFLYEEILPVSYYPIIPIINRFHRNPFPDSDVRLARPLQKYLNKLRSLIMAHATNSTSLKVLLPRGSVDKKVLEMEWGKAGTTVIEFDAELGQPVIAGPVPLPNELYALEEKVKADIQFLFGIWELQHGNPQAMPETYKGTIAVDEFGQRRIKSKRDDIESAINLLAKVVVQYVQKYWTRERTLRLVESDRREVKINIPIYDDLTNEVIGKLNDITTTEVDVIMVSGSTLPSNRWARFEYYLQLYQLGIIDDIELLKQTEVVDINAVIERKSIYMQLRQALAQAQETIKKLEGDLQTAQREAVHANKKAELEKFKAHLMGIKKNLELASDRTEVNLKAYEQIEKSKIKKNKDIINQTKGGNNG